MGRLRFTAAMSRGDLVRDCLTEIRGWPGCETVAAIGVFADAKSGFVVRILEYGSANKRLADRAALCVQREKVRRFHMVIE